VMVVFNYSELVDSQPVVSINVFEIDELDLVALDNAVFVDVLNVHAFGDQLVKPTVLLDQRRRDSSKNLLDGVCASLFRNGGIKTLDSGNEAASKDDFTVTPAFGSGCIRPNIRAVRGLVTEARENSERRLLHDFL